MRVEAFSNLGELAPHADDWGRLDGDVPFRSWTWLSTWWRHYGADRRLYVLAVFDEADALVGVAPWYIDLTASLGRVVRPLGSGEVCSDYLSILCSPGSEEPVTAALAERLTDDAHANGRHPFRFDLLELSGFDARDEMLAALCRRLAELGNTVHRRNGPNCWRIELPATLDEYLASLSKKHRAQLRRLDRREIATGGAVMRTVKRTDELSGAVETLVNLHQRRRQTLGEPGCFTSQRFDAFQRDVIPQLLRNGQLELYVLTIDGKPAAAEYGLHGGNVIYIYQTGLDPDLLDRQPGKLITLTILKRAIEQGYRAIDFMRGDEPYKPHWRADPWPGVEVRVVPRRVKAQLRHNLWLAGSRVKRWIKSGMKT